MELGNGAKFRSALGGNVFRDSAPVRRAAARNPTTAAETKAWRRREGFIFRLNPLSSDWGGSPALSTIRLPIPEQRTSPARALATLESLATNGRLGLRLRPQAMAAYQPTCVVRGCNPLRPETRASAARASSEYRWMRLWGNAKIGCSSMSRCGLVCFGMQVHGSTPGDSQQVEDVAIIDTGSPGFQPGMSQKGGKRTYRGRPGNDRSPCQSRHSNTSPK